MINGAAKEQYTRFVVGFVLLAFLCVVSAFNYLLFHSLVELFSVLVASGTFVVAWNARRFLRNHYFLFVGIAYLSVALLHAIHLITYKGMAVIPGLGANEPTQLWIATRYIQSLSLLLAPIFIRRYVPAGRVLLGYVAVTAAVLFTVFVWPVFPDCFIEGRGITLFKKTSEFVVCGLYLWSVVLLLREREAFEHTVLQLLIGSVGLAGLSGVIFTLYKNVTDPVNITGHLVIVVSFYLMYKAVILTSLLKPYDLLFRELKASEASLLQTHGELERRVEERTHELAQTTEALRKEKERYRQIVETATEGIWVLDARGQTSFVNQRMAEILGHGVDEMLNRRVFEFMDAEGQKMAEAGFSRHIRGLADRQDFRFLRKNGEDVWCSVSTSAIFHENGRYGGALIMATDLTERRRLEAQLRESHKMEAVGTLAGGIAHDFNNILAAIIGFTEMTLQRCEDIDPIKRRLTQVLKAGLRGRELVKQILTFSRRGEQQLRPLRIARLVLEAIRLLKASLPTNIRIEQKIDRHALTILADPTQMHRVLMNLSSNAIDAMRDKGGVLTIVLENRLFQNGDSTPHPDITPGRYVRLSVGDSGIGMTREVRERIFEPFFSTKPSGHGTGLGLSVIYGIVKRHEGVICVESEAGKGSAFEIFFPAIPSDDAGGRQASEPASEERDNTAIRGATDPMTERTECRE